MRDARRRASTVGAFAAVLGAAALLSGCGTTTKTHAPLVMTPPACADFSVSIYFDASSARLTREANELIRAAAGRTVGCVVQHVAVVGLADAPGDPDANLELSKKRADAVTQALARNGFADVSFHVKAAGDVGAQTAGGEAKPLRRRADVQFHVVPRG